MRKFLGGGIALIVACLGFWFYGMHALENYATQQVEVLRTAGWNVSYARLEKTGFPFQAGLRFVAPVIQKIGFCEVRAPGDVVLKSNLWRPRQVSLRIADPILFMAGDEENFALRGRVTRLEGTIAAALYQLTATAVEIETSPWGPAHVDTLIWGISPEPDAHLNMVLYGVQGALLRDHPLGERIEEASLKARNYGDFTGDTWDARCRSWAGGQGRLEVEKVRLKWGSLDLVGTGAWSLDESLQPAGELQLQVQGAAQTIDMLIARGALDATLGGMLKMGAALIALPGSGQDGPAPLTFHLKKGQVYMGTIPLWRSSALTVQDPGRLDRPDAPRGPAAP